METHILKPKSHTHIIIIYGIISFILLLVSAFFLAGYFFKWWPYRDEKTSKDKKVNQKILYVSIALLIISVLVLIIIIITASSMRSDKPIAVRVRKGLPNEQVQQNSLAFSQPTQQFIENIEQREIQGREIQAREIAESKLVDPEKIAAEELINLSDPQADLSQSQKEAYERAIQVRMLAEQSLKSRTPSLVFSEGEKRLEEILSTRAQK